MDEWAMLNWFGSVNYQTMEWTNDWWWRSWIALFFAGTFFGMSPLSTYHEQTFLQICAVWIRRTILVVGFCLVCMPFIMLYIYDMTMQHELGDAVKPFLMWFKKLAVENWWKLGPAMIAGWALRFCYNRYVLTFISSVERKLRRNQTDEVPSDIRDEAKKYKPKQFLPRKYYTPTGVTVGLDINDKPVVIPWEVWQENMMQIIGPTGFGKGVILGGIAEQVIEKGHTVFSINPKKDKFLPHIMYNAAKKLGRKFYYVSLRDGELGSWGPFLGGDEEDAFTRLTMAFKLELTGEPKTDFYKRQEIRLLRRAFKKSRRIDGLYNEIHGEEAATAEAELEVWKDYKSLCPGSKKGFSIAKAIEENAIVYVQGSLDSRVVKTATKLFIAELIQESRRLWDNGVKKHHLDIFIDETSFLISKVVKEALATIRSYEVSIVNAYQSPNDLLNIDDDAVDGKSLQHSVNINSQIKAVYGGADYDLAEWAALMSGTTTKQVTKMEKTDVKAGGGETWEENRTVGSLEENLIHPNVLLSLPAGICVFKQPYQLPVVLHTSYVPVEDRSGLNEYLNRSNNSSEIEDKLSSSRQTSSVVAGTDATENLHIEHFQKLGDKSETDPLERTFLPASAPKAKPLEKKENPISHAKSEMNTTENTAGLETANLKKEGTTSLSGATHDSSQTQGKDPEQADKKREKNKARRRKQKEKRSLAHDQEAPTPKAEAGTDSIKVEDDGGDDGLAGFLEATKSHSDDSLLKALSKDEEN